MKINTSYKNLRTILSVMVLFAVCSFLFLNAPPASASLFSNSRDAVCDGAQLQGDPNAGANATGAPAGNATQGAADAAVGGTLPGGLNDAARNGATQAAANNAAGNVISDGLNVGSTGQCSSQAAKTINKVIKIGLNILSIIIGLAAVFMIMIAGFKFITSQGESSNIAGARNTILYAIIGLVIVALAQFIVRFVLTKTA